MQNIWKKLQSPRGLIIFEAAARLGSFTKAADELSLQQPSVSAAIKQLEIMLNAQLFYRRHKNITLTSTGERLYAGVARALSDLETTLTSVQQMSERSFVTLSSSSAFSFYWMMPKLPQLRALYPALDVRLQNSDREPDLDAENLSLAIRIGKVNAKESPKESPWPECHSALLALEKIYPVANPMVMASARNLRSIPNLLHERLIHLEEPIRERPTWSQWFAHHDIKDRHLEGGLRLNDYALVLQAAISGEGFAFGWDHIVRDLITDGLLAARTNWAWRTGRGVYLVWSKNKALTTSAQQVRDFIISESDYPEQIISS